MSETNNRFEQPFRFHSKNIVKRAKCNKLYTENCI